MKNAKERIDWILRDLDYKPKEQWRERLEQILTEEFSADNVITVTVAVTRYYAQTKDASSSIDIAEFEGEGIDFRMDYEMAKYLFGIDIDPGETVEYQVKPFAMVDEP